MIDFKINTVSLGDETYPLLLRETKGAPIKMFYRGILPSAKEPTIAIVGTRKATEEGKIVASKISEELSREGFTVISGLAMGIDSAAHLGALKTKGKTIAVLANGLKSVYPALNERLASDILENGGSLISEYQPEEPPYQSRFLERNRIIAGLSVATVVIEAPIKSGALTTARFAAEEGRDVFVVPGRVRDKNYEGSHLLIRNGARLVSSSKDILDDIFQTIQDLGMKLGSSTERTDSLDDYETLLLLSLEKSGIPLTIDNLAEITHLEIHIINKKLTFLLLYGLIEEKAGKFGIKKK